MGQRGFFLTLEEVASVIERFGDNEAVLQGVLNKINPPPEVAFLINLEAMCERYSCLPKELLAEDAYYLRAFQSILKGKMKGMESKTSNNPQPNMSNLTNKQLKKSFR